MTTSEIAAALSRLDPATQKQLLGDAARNDPRRALIETMVDEAQARSAARRDPAPR